MNTNKLKVVLSFLLIIIFMFGGCCINMANSTPTKVRILIGGGPQALILIDIVNDHTFEATRFSNSWSVSPRGDDAFDETLLEDFVSIDPHLCEMLGNPFGSESSYGARTRFEKWEVELSQQQWDDVWNRVVYVANNDTDGAFELSLTIGLPYIWAIIDGRFYWSLYDRFTALSHPYNQFVNRNLVLLADDLTSLADVSPFRSGR